jgi:hypothetical protein
MSRVLFSCRCRISDCLFSVRVLCSLSCRFVVFHHEQPSAVLHSYLSSKLVYFQLLNRRLSRSTSSTIDQRDKHEQEPMNIIDVSRFVELTNDRARSDPMRRRDTNTHAQCLQQRDKSTVRIVSFRLLPLCACAQSVARSFVFVFVFSFLLLHIFLIAAFFIVIFLFSLSFLLCFFTDMFARVERTNEREKINK